MCEYTSTNPQPRKAGCFTRDAKLVLERHQCEPEGRDYDGILEWIAAYLSAEC